MCKQMVKDSAVENAPVDNGPFLKHERKDDHGYTNETKNDEAAMCNGQTNAFANLLVSVCDAPLSFCLLDTILNLGLLLLDLALEGRTSGWICGDSGLAVDLGIVGVGFGVAIRHGSFVHGGGKISETGSNGCIFRRSSRRFMCLWIIMNLVKEAISYFENLVHKGITSLYDLVYK